MNEDMIARTIETLLSPIYQRQVNVTFSKLGKDRNFSMAIQSSLLDFENTDSKAKPSGSMYLNLNKDLLQDVGELVSTLNEIAWR